MAQNKQWINVNYFDDVIMMMVTIIFLTSEYIKPIILKLNLHRTELRHSRVKSVTVVKTLQSRFLSFQWYKHLPAIGCWKAYVLVCGCQKNECSCNRARGTGLFQRPADDREPALQLLSQLLVYLKRVTDR